MFLKEFNLLIWCKKFSYLFVLAGTLIESDMMMITAGYNTFLGQFQLLQLMGFVFIVTVLANQICFAIGKRFTYLVNYFLDQKKTSFITKKIKKIYKYFQKYGNFIGIIFRFLTSVRLLTPFVLGTTAMTHKRFLILNIISAFLWVIVVCGGGYLLAHYCGYDAALKLFHYMPIVGLLLMIIIFVKSVFF